MKLKVRELNTTHVGCLCAIEWSIQSSGFVGHSSRHGLESGSVTTSHHLVGRLCYVDQEVLMFLTAWHSRHSMDLSYSLGPVRSIEYDIYTVDRKNFGKDSMIFVNISEESNSIRQHFSARDRVKKLWAVWPSLSRHIHEL